MHTFDRFTRIVAAVALLMAFAAAGDARTRKGDRFFAQGAQAETRKDWDTALSFYEKALAEDPGDTAYDLATKRVRFQAGEFHIKAGRKLRNDGDLEKALEEFQRAYAIDPSSDIAQQEIQQTREAIERNKKGAQLKPEERGLTAAELQKREEAARLARLEPPPELRPLARQPINLRMANQPPKVLFDTVGKLAGINVVFDPEYGQQGGVQHASVELNNSTLEDALNYVAAMTHSFWKPLSENAIFVTQENVQKRRDYEDSVVRVFYLTNLTAPTELQEISTVLRTVVGVNKVFPYTSLNALVARGSSDQITLCEKLVSDLDKPKSEVVVDVIVMEANKNTSRNLAATLASGTAAGINTAIQFAPTHPISGGNSNNSGGTGTDTGGGTGTTGGSTTSTLMSLSRIAKLSTNDFAITMPNALLQAVISDANTKVLQSPQVRASNGQKASLKVGQKVPVSSGGIQPTTGVGLTQLYNQFQFLDVGVNLDMTPTVHNANEVTLKLSLDISSVVDHVTIAGVDQPIIGQRKIEHEIRLREGEVSLLGGLMQDQDTKSISGVPGLANIPGLRWLFSSNSVTHSRQELLIALIPHIVRTPGITDLNLRSIAVGTDQNVRLRFQPKPDGVPATPAPGAMPQPSVQQPAEPAPPAPRAVPTQVLFRPATLEIQSGATFTLELGADNAQDLAAAPFHLKFDPQLLKLQDIKPGTLMSSDGQQIIFTRNILNDSGDATVNLNRMPGTSGVNGSGSLAVFTFQALKPGAAAVTFTELNVQNSQGQPVAQTPPQATITIR